VAMNSADRTSVLKTCGYDEFYRLQVIARRSIGYFNSGFIPDDGRTWRVGQRPRGDAYFTFDTASHAILFKLTHL
jgi:hypothetical protein